MCLFSKQVKHFVGDWRVAFAKVGSQVTDFVLLYAVPIPFAGK
jgi:hypothetical protein